MKHITDRGICASCTSAGSEGFFDYADRGSYSEDTLRANRADLEAISFASASGRHFEAPIHRRRSSAKSIAALSLAPVDYWACSTATAKSPLPRRASRRHPVR